MSVLNHFKNLFTVSLITGVIVIGYTKQAYSQKNSFPYELSLKKDLIIGSGGLLLSGIGGFIPEQSHSNDIEYFNNLNRNDVNGLDRWVTYKWNPSSDRLRSNLRFGALIGSLTLIPGVAAVYDSESDKKQNLNNALTVGAMGLEGVSYVLGCIMISKGLITRNRPYAYNPEVSYNEKIDGSYKESFFSGTTATTSFAMFFSAKVINDLYPDSKWKYAGWGFAAAYTGYVGYLAMDAGQHFPTDVVSGAIIGGLIGFIIPEMHKKKDDSSDVSISPRYDTPGLSLALSF